jgi:chorismate mutase
MGGSKGEEELMMTRGIRGAITIESDIQENVLSATSELLNAIVASNPGLKTDSIGSAFFTVTDDIASTYPALAARQMDWDQVPMMCAREIPVTGSLSLCIRVLIHWNTDKTQKEIRHVYLRDAIKLRPDLVNEREEKSK